MAEAICGLENENTLEVKRIVKSLACTTIISFSAALATRKYFEMKWRCARC
jgi:hypothetical protein